MSPKIGVLFFAKFLTVITIAIKIPACYTETNFKFNSIAKNSSISIVDTSSLFTSTEIPLRMTVKKWQVGRVSRKHYEIVNMLWRKTKIFINPETTTPAEYRFRRNHPKATSMNKYDNIKPVTLSSARPLFPSSTPSFIEFYYLDDNDDRIKRRDSMIPMLSSHRAQRKPALENPFIRSPILSVHIDDYFNKNSPPKLNLAIGKETPEPSHLIRKRPIIHQKPSIYGFLSNKFQIDLVPMVKSNTLMFNTNLKPIVTTEKYFDNETCPVTTEPEIYINSTTPQNDLNTHHNNDTQDEMAVTQSNTLNITSDKIKSTTAYDKIKFFEMYDQHTMKPISINNRNVNEDDSENMITENDIDVKQKVKLEDIDHNIGHHNGTQKKLKKHIDENSNLSLTKKTNNSKSEKKTKFKTVLFNVNKTDTKKPNDVENAYKALKKIQNDTWVNWKNSSRIAMLSEYPFAAVYVYEPSQIHCDAAALSPHWLVAAGSCLSRFHRNNPITQGRSAFVAYCGQNWWQPERVSYVKYSIVHPRYHPKDPTRRFLYNIGLVQVVGSMSSCFGWAPISLMSHNFDASDDSMATAVGWGLDRYDVRYTSAELPKLPLSAYDGFVFSNSCPGSKALGKLKLYNEPSSAVKNNLYCLSLPPYTGEENDPVHGSLLLVGGKLIALYLQEERRVWGEQSAQYTGVWRLVPWVHEVAREPDEVDGFGIDI